MESRCTWLGKPRARLTIRVLIVIILTMSGELDAAFVCTALMRIGTRMATVFDQHFAESGVTQAQFRVLLAICEQGGPEGMPPSALAEHLLLERATVSVLTQRMVERGLLAREPGANRRTFNLSLTSEGREFLHRLLPQATALANKTLSGISPHTLREMQAALQTAERRLRHSSEEE